MHLPETLFVLRTNSKVSKKKPKRNKSQLILREATSFSRVKSLSSQASRVFFQSRMSKMLRQTRVFLIIRRNSKNRSRSTMPSLHLERKVRLAMTLNPVRSLRNLLSTTVVNAVRVESVSPELLKLLRKPKRTVTTALSKLMVKRDAVVKAEEAVAEAEVAVEASIREKTSRIAEAHARMTHKRLPLMKLQASQLRKRRMMPLKLPFPLKTLRAGVVLLSSDEPIS